MAGIGQRYVGSSVRRSEDGRILTGRGHYLDDVRLPGMAHAAFVRSPLAHARVVSVDVAAARSLPGVLAVYTAAEMEPQIVRGTYGMAAAYGMGPLQGHDLLASDKVRLVGDLVAMVVAESRYIAEDALDLVDVQYDELTPITSVAEALDPTNPVIFEDHGSNVLIGPYTNTHGDVDEVFAAADRVLRTRLEQHRHQHVPMECRGVVAEFDAATGRFTVHSANQGVHPYRVGLSKRLGVPPDEIRVVTGDIGGSFGLKIGAWREDVAVAVASRDLRRPVKWIEDRTENLTASGQAREESMDVEVACTNDGVILGLRCNFLVDAGAYPGMGGTLGYIVEGMIPGPYGIRALEFTATAAITNKASYMAYRGPWAAETFVRERVVDLVARELGLEPLEVRRRNVVRHDAERPPTMITGRSLAGITVAQSYDRLAEVFDLDEFRRRQRDARESGRYLGVGIASYIEAAPGPKGSRPGSGEQMTVELAEDGTVVVYTGQMPHGQSHETTIAQVVADQFGVPFDDVRVVVGDTDRVPVGSTGGSRAATMMGGAALHAARALRAKVLDAASGVMEASVDDLEIVDGVVLVRGVPARGMPLAALVATLFGDDSSGDHEPLRHEERFDGGEGGWSGGTHCAVVEVDIGTGLVSFQRYIVVEDCGEVINPAVVDGQIRGGIAQGLGAVLLERSLYNESGQFVSATMVDYLLPSTMDVPRIEIHHLDAIPLDPHVNFRGVGEGGMIVAPATICSAIEDALAPFGARVNEQHLPPTRVLELAGIIPAEA